MKTSRWLFWRVAAFSLVVLLSACANATPVPPTSTPTRERPPTETPGPTATPQATPTTAPSPTPTPIVPAVEAIQQRIDETSLVTVSSLTIPEPGWLVILASDEDAPGEVIGSVAVPAGSSRDVAVEIDPYVATTTLFARLHEDTGEPELFEFPEGDPPLAWNGEPVEAAFSVTLDLILPSVTMAEQTIARDGQVIVESVSVPEAGWITLHADADGEPGAILGQTPLLAGDHENALIAFNWRQATSPMHVVLYQDLGIEGRFEPETVDAPYLSQGEPISATFAATLPLDVHVINQPVAATGEVVVERVSVGRPAWVAVYTDFAGYSDRLLGFAQVAAGATEGLVIPVETRNLTSLLHIRVHADEGTEGEFDNPGTDFPLDEEGRLTLFSFQIDAGSYVVTVDQPAGAEVDVPLVVADTAVWLLILEQEEDAPEELPGQVLGSLWLAPGIHRDLVVPVDGASAGTTLLAALYLDAGEEESFEFPDGPDVPMRQLRAFIRAPFALTP